MKKLEIIFKEIQLFYISIIPLLIILITLSILFFGEIGTKKITLYPYIAVVSLFLFILINTYKLELLISSNLLIISFGVGLIKKKIPINHINKHSIYFMNIPWYYGIGLRVANKVIIYNTKPGKAIVFDVNNKSHAIVSDKSDKIKQFILQS